MYVCVYSGGVFTVLLVGLIISIMVSMFEFYYYRKKIKHIEQVTNVYLNWFKSFESLDCATINNK